MRVEIDKRFVGKAMKDRRRMERVLLRRARPIARRLQAGTPVRTGHTAGTTTIETGHTNVKRDRVAVRIVQRGAASPQNFRTTLLGRFNANRNYMLKAL